MKTSTCTTWKSQIHQILKEKNLICIHQTAESAQCLHDTYGFFANGRELSHDVEQKLFDMFVDNDYDGTLHLTTIHKNLSTSTDRNEKNELNMNKEHKSTILQHESGSKVDPSENGRESESKPESEPPGGPSTNYGPPLGLVFWREVPDDEMLEWIDWSHVAKYFGNISRVLGESSSLLGDEEYESQSMKIKPFLRKSSKTSLDPSGMSSNDPSDTTNIALERKIPGGLGLSLVRQQSIESIRSMVSNCPIRSRQVSNSNIGIISSISSAVNEEPMEKMSTRALTVSLPLPPPLSLGMMKKKLTHAWIKIELVAVRQPYWGQRLGSILFACALYHAHCRHQSRVILHVAGGEENVPAVRMYRRFGFLPVKTTSTGEMGDGGDAANSTGTATATATATTMSSTIGRSSTRSRLFHKPNRDLYILGDIEKSLADLAFEKALGIVP